MILCVRLRHVYPCFYCYVSTETGKKLNDKRIISPFFAQHFTRSCNILLQVICLKVGVQIRCSRNGRVTWQIVQGHRVNAGGLAVLAENRRTRLVTSLLEGGEWLKEVW
jgi:hypothetical protein